MMKIHDITVATALLLLYASTVSTTADITDYQRQWVLSLAGATSEFSNNLYNKIAAKHDNLIFSPYSIHSALTMTSVGAGGGTLSQMRNVLGITSFGNEASDAYRTLNEQLNSAEFVQLNTANALFVNPELQLNAKFREDVTEKFSAKVSKFDYSSPGGPEKAINDFVAKKTRNVIKKIVKPGNINPGTIMLLINTIFFNGTWENQFAEYLTEKQDFNQLNGNIKKVDMMHMEEWLPYKRDTLRKADILMMPFRGNRFSLTILLPHTNKNFAHVENSVNAFGADDIYQGLQTTRVRLSLPKFKIETQLDLPYTLRAMGMNDAFSPFSADFTGINEQGNFYIDQVMHKAVIDVNESGTVAAAVTSVGIGMSASPPTEAIFTADRPFLFFLRDYQTRQVLFRGKFSG